MKLSPDVIFRKQLNGKGGDVRVLQHGPTEQVPQQDLKQEISREVGNKRQDRMTGMAILCFSCRL